MNFVIGHLKTEMKGFKIRNIMANQMPFPNKKPNKKYNNVLK